MKKCLVVVAVFTAACSPPAAAPAEADTKIPTAMALSTETEATEPTPPIDFPPPKLSPIGDQPIIFASDATGDDEIYAVNADGSGLIQVTYGPMSSERCPQWSPDGTQVAFLSQFIVGGEIAKSNLVIANTDGTVAAVIEPSPSDSISLCA